MADDRHIYLDEGIVVKDGSCDFCVDRLHTKIYILQSNHPQRNLVIKLCSRCMWEVFKYVSIKEETRYKLESKKE